MEIVDLARIENGKFQIEVEPTNLNHLLQDFIQHFSASERIEITLETEANLPPILADKICFRQVLNTFVEKGVDHYPAQVILRAKVKDYNIHLEIHFPKGKISSGKLLLRPNISLKSIKFRQR